MDDPGKSGPPPPEEVSSLRARLATLEDALERVTHDFSGALEQGQAAVYRRNFDTSVYEYMGPYVEQITGYSPRELTPEVWDRLVVRVENRGRLEGLSLEEAYRRVRSGEVDRWLADILVRTKTGSTRWVADLSTALFDRAGHCYGCLGILQDITERKLAEQHLAEITSTLRQRNEEMEADLGLARQTQRAFLPHTFPRVRSARRPDEDAFSFCYRYTPAGKVSGDLFAVLPLSESRAGIFLCDVMGHGVRAALITALVHALVHALAGAQESPGALLEELNRRYLDCLRVEEETVFTTALFAVADADEERFSLALAGHPGPLHLRHEEGDVVSLFPESTASGPALGLDRQATYVTQDTPMHAGDRFFFYTDGLIEAENRERTQFGVEGLRQSLGRCRTLTAPRLIEAVSREVADFAASGSFEDDVCMLLMEVS